MAENVAKKPNKKQRVGMDIQPGYQLQGQLGTQGFNFFNLLTRLVASSGTGSSMWEDVCVVMAQPVTEHTYTQTYLRCSLSGYENTESKLHWTYKPVSLRLTAPAVGCTTSRVGGRLPAARLSSAVVLSQDTDMGFYYSVGNLFCLLPPNWKYD